jgi:methyl-accepting chemotaxis protein
MGDVRQLCESKVISVGSMVLNQERELSFQLANIELLQRKSQNYGGRIQDAFAKLSRLLELVNDHLGRSQVIRKRLLLLTFNSLIEANRLGQQGAVVSAIANLIKGVSGEWNTITDQSRQALGQIQSMVKHTNTVMDIDSESSKEKLRDDQTQTRAVLDSVRATAEFVAQESELIEVVTKEMQSNLNHLGSPEDELGACFRNIDAVVVHIENLTHKLRRHDAQIELRADAAKVERLFSTFYTTETERNVMSAALRGAPMPLVLQASFAGNDAELF